MPGWYRLCKNSRCPVFAVSRDGNARNGSSRGSLPVGNGSVPVSAPVALGNRPMVRRGWTMRAKNAFTLSGVSAPSSVQTVSRQRGFQAVTMATRCSTDRLSLPGFMPRGTLADAAFDIGVTIAASVSGRLPLPRRALVAVGRGDDAARHGGPGGPAAGWETVPLCPRHGPRGGGPCQGPQRGGS